jgi:trk system potassium uptake protein
MNMRLLDTFIGAVALGAFLLLLGEHSPLGVAYADHFYILNFASFLIFATDVLLRIVLAENRAEYLKRKWFDLIVFIPLLQYVPALRNPSILVVLRQVVIVTILVSRSRKAGRLLTLISLRPAHLMALSFAFAIGIGAVLLMQPAALAPGVELPLVDALFTATSATCVTGLVVRDTATAFTPLGQAVIAGLIQIGGLGIMTFSVSLAVFLGRQIDVRRQAAMQDMLDHDALSDIRRLLLFIVGMTVFFEAAGATALTLAWRSRFPTLGATAGHAVFHAVSAFCNAGFSTFSDSLVGFQGDVATNLIVIVLILGGGIGFLVVRDLLRRAGRGRAARSPLRPQTRLVFIASLALLVAGWILFAVFERGRVLAGMPPGRSLLVALFQSVTTRTAGFNTCAIGALSAPTLLFMMALMFIGASPGSTGGGIKTTTAAVLAASVFASLRHRDDTEIHRRTVPRDVTGRALSVMMLSLAVVIGFALVLLYVERHDPLAVLFETVSAFGTVGLSTGITPELSAPGRVAVMVLMYVGRLGPLTVAYVFARRRPPPRYRYAEERVMIG